MDKTILISTDNFMPRIDGIAKFLEILIPEIKDYKIIVLAPEFPGDFRKSNNYELHRVKLHKYKIGDYQIPKKPEKIKDLVNRCSFVFNQTIGPIGSAVIKEAKRQGKKVVSFIHSIEWILVEKCLSRWNIAKGIISFVAKIYARRIYSKCDTLIVPSNNVGELFSFQGIRNPKYVVPLGIDIDHFSPSSKEESKKKLGISENDFVVGYVGRIAREKDLLTLRSAFDKLEKPKKLLIVGDGLPSLKTKIDSNNTIMPGRVDDVVPYLNAMDVFVMPSLIETTCIAALEAMSCELPVVSTKSGSLKNYITHKENGFFFPKKNSTILSILLDYIRKNPLQAKNIAKNARKTVVKQHSWDVTKRKLLKVLEEQVP
jgi:glycosyltransferase involved in cell wall biosynthesis